MHCQAELGDIRCLLIAGQKGGFWCHLAECAQPLRRVAVCGSAAAPHRSGIAALCPQAFYGGVRWRSGRYPGNMLIHSVPMRRASAHNMRRRISEKCCHSFGRTLLQLSLNFSPCTRVCLTDQVPAMGDSISEGTIAVWHKKAGDQVRNACVPSKCKFLPAYSMHASVRAPKFRLINLKVTAGLLKA